MTNRSDGIDALFGAVYPDETDTRAASGAYGPTDGVASKPGELNGNYQPALESDVQQGVQYGANGTEFTGTLLSGGDVVLPSVLDVQQGVQFGDPGNLSTGVLVLPGESDVRKDIGYGALDEFVGTLEVGLAVDDSGQIVSPIVIGDDYLDANGRGFEWTIKDGTASLSGYTTAKLKGWSYIDSVAYEWEATGTATDSAGDWVIKIDLPAAATAAMRPGLYDWAVTLTDSQDRVITTHINSRTFPFERVALVESGYAEYAF